MASRLELCNVKGIGGRSFALRSVFWPVALRGALDGDVPQWEQVAAAVGGTSQNSTRRAMMDFSLFCSRYRSEAPPEGTGGRLNHGGFYEQKGSPQVSSENKVVSTLTRRLVLYLLHLPAG